MTLNFHFRADEAIASYRKAIELAPSFASAWQFLAEAWSVSGHHPEAIAAADQAVELEPFSPVVHAVRGLVLLAARRPQAALEALDQALLLDPRFTWVHRYRAHALTRLGRKRAAAAAFVAEVQGWGEHGEELAKLERLVAERDLTGYWEWRLAQLLAMRGQGGAPGPTQLAEALAALGRNEEALTELARAPAALDGEYFLHYRESPAFDGLRSDPRFIALYSQFGL